MTVAANTTIAAAPASRMNAARIPPKHEIGHIDQHIRPILATLVDSASRLIHHPAGGEVVLSEPPHLVVADERRMWIGQCIDMATHPGYAGPLIADGIQQASPVETILFGMFVIAIEAV